MKIDAKVLEYANCSVGNRPPPIPFCVSDNEYMAIDQQKPGKVSWILWRKAMSLWANELMLCKPLGKWYKYGDELDC
eukprot:10118740-Ditylum_brightwellii.AAC.1